MAEQLSRFAKAHSYRRRTTSTTRPSLVWVTDSGKIPAAPAPAESTDIPIDPDAPGPQPICPVCATRLTAKSYVEIDKPVYDPAKRQRTLVRMRRPVRHCPACKRLESEFHQRGKHSHLYKTKNPKVHVPEARRGY